MGTCFKPLRRKIGVLTLGLACVFMAGWVRSVVKEDRLRGTRIDAIRSRNGVVERVKATLKHEILDQYINENGTEVSEVSVESIESIVWQIPYWSIVIPLTLLSAWLLLSKPRMKPAEKPA